ncbi:uncharacterized protein GGS25DRAFT_284891 [Hypoxylon fragiforme]|uniref:uncharacterized protein n=1 Tax=Hypoxylon fragiforme TaxID=63214 RepID=UPI0020C5D4EE|nr:uncharacterized protein GGS25DRAFT_284891 [Hypoxylon fragiforme]KAI2608613.1 hypothetical protein GGS25DRAFT_284891 [Hypoxylon fragiforme]
MFCLAIMLLEIKFGRPIESLQQQEDFGPNGIPNEATDLTTTNRWRKGEVEQGNLSWAFAKAIIYYLPSMLSRPICIIW